MKNKAKDKKSEIAAVSGKRVEKLNDKKKPLAKPAVSKKAPIMKKAKAVPAKAEGIKSKPKKVAAHKLPGKFAHMDENFFKGRKKYYFDLLMLARAQILGQLKFHSDEALETNAASGLAGSMSNHMADFGSDNFLHEMELDLLSNEGEVLEMIDEAIERLESDEYGKCLDCGCDIKEERLKVKPYARFCIKCKSKQESDGNVSAG